MALLYMDGFDHYYTTVGNTSATNMEGVAPNLWTNPDTNTSSSLKPQIKTMLGVSTGYGLYTQLSGGSTNYGGIRLLLPYTITSGTTLGIGMHLYMVNLPASISHPLGNFLTYSPASGSMDRCWKIGSDGKLNWSNGIGWGSVQATSTEIFSASTLYHVELKVYFHASAGTIEARVNGQVWLSATGLNTLGSTTKSHIGFWTGNGSGYFDGNWSYIDNLYIWDGTGGVNNDFLGERIIETLFPNADTAQADWSLSTGSNGYNLLNDVPDNPSTNYIEATTVDDQSTFDMGSLVSPGLGIAAVQVNARARKTNAGASKIKFGVVAGSTESLSGDFEPALDQTQPFHKVFDVNPDTSAAWEVAEVNAAQVTVKKTA